MRSFLTAAQNLLAWLVVAGTFAAITASYGDTKSSDNRPAERCAPSP